MSLPAASILATGDLRAWGSGPLGSLWSRGSELRLALNASGCHPATTGPSSRGAWARPPAQDHGALGILAHLRADTHPGPPGGEASGGGLRAEPLRDDRWAACGGGTILTMNARCPQLGNPLPCLVQAFSCQAGPGGPSHSPALGLSSVPAGRAWAVSCVSLEPEAWEGGS